MLIIFVFKTLNQVNVIKLKNFDLNVSTCLLPFKIFKRKTMRMQWHLFLTSQNAKIYKRGFDSIFSLKRPLFAGF